MLSWVQSDSHSEISGAGLSRPVLAAEANSQITLVFGGADISLFLSLIPVQETSGGQGMGVGC